MDNKSIKSEIKSKCMIMEVENVEINLTGGLERKDGSNVAGLRGLKRKEWL